MKERQTNAWPQISESELEVMKVLWQYQQPLSSGEIIEALTAQTLWKPKTIQTMLNRLVAKGAVAADKNGGKAYAYQALVAEEEYKLKASEHFLDKLYAGSMKSLVAQFVRQEKISPEEKEALRCLLEEGER